MKKKSSRYDPARHGIIEPLECRIAPASLISLTDTDGDKYTVKLKGNGTATVVPLDPGGTGHGPIDSITLLGTDSKSSLSITVAKNKSGGDGRISIGSIISGGLAAFSAPAADLTGSAVFAGGVGSIALGNISPGVGFTLGGTAANHTNFSFGTAGDSFTLSSFSTIAALTAASFGQGSVSAPSIHAITTKHGGFGLDVTTDGAIAKIITAGATTGDWMAGSFGSITVKGGDLDAMITSTAPAGKTAGIGTVSVTGGNLGGTLSAVGKINSVSIHSTKVTTKVNGAKVVTVVGGGFADPMGASIPHIAAASLGSLKASGDVVGTLDVSAAIGSITAGGLAGGDWTASSFGTISVSGGDFSANVDATAQQMAAGRTPAINRLQVNHGILTGDVTANGAINTLLLSTAEGGGIMDGQVVAKSIGSITVGALDNALILAGANSASGPFAAGSIGRLTIKGDVTSSTVGAGLASDDAVFGDGDDTVAAGGAIKAFTVAGTASDDSFFASAALPKTVTIGKAKIDPTQDSRFLTTGSTDVRSPVITAGLANDTGLLNTDGITADPTINGKVRDAGGVQLLKAGLDGTAVANFSDVTSSLTADKLFSLTVTDLEALASGTLANGPHILHLQATDAHGNVTGVYDVAFTLTGFQLISHTPTDGSSELGVTYHPQINFSRPVDTATLNSSNFYATYNGQKLPATIVPSNDGTFAWLFFTQNLPNSAQLQVTVDGSTIMAKDGSGALDAAGNATPGSPLHFAFTTVSTTPLTGTSLSGRIVDPGADKVPMSPDDFDAGADGKPGTADDVYKLPIAGVKVYIIGQETQAVFSDANGFFHFDNVPAGDVKIVVSGLTATSPPAGFYFPEMVMDAQMQVGQANTVMPGMSAMYLPRVASSVLHDVSSATGMDITANAASAPDLTPAQRALLSINVPAHSFVGDTGTQMSNANIGISTVPGSLVMDMLPAGLLQHSFDITVQAPGVTKFSSPVPLTVPNVFNAAPGTKLNFLSFDHTTGRLVIEGTGTVSDDGLSVSTDAGVGVTHPGWHAFTPPGSQGNGPNGPPPPPPPPWINMNQAAQDVIDFTTQALDCAAGLAGVKGWLQIALKVPGQISDLQQKIGDLDAALKANNDSATAIAAFQTINSLKNTVVADVTALADEAKSQSPLGKVLAVIDCANGILDKAKSICDQIANGPCGNATLKVVCLGLGAVSDVIGYAKSLADAVEDAEKGLVGMVALKATCATLTFIDKALSIPPKTPSALAPAPSGPVSQDVLDKLDLLVNTQLPALAAEAGTGTAFDQFAHAIQQFQSTTQDTFNQATDYYNQIHTPASNAYWALEYKDSQGMDTIIRGRTDNNGKFNFFMPAKTDFTLLVYDQNSNRLATFNGTSSDSGVPTQIPELAFLSVTNLPDNDGDGLVNLAEKAVGTDPNKADTNADGINDFAEVQAGLNPLAANAYPTGIIASLPIAGEATKVALSGTGTGFGPACLYCRRHRRSGDRRCHKVECPRFGQPVVTSRSVHRCGRRSDLRLRRRCRRGFRPEFRQRDGPKHADAPDHAQRECQRGRGRGRDRLCGLGQQPFGL